jgi:integrase
MGKRGKGEGSIYKRDDGLWVGSLSLGYVQGKRKRKTVYGQTRREVVAKLDKLKQDEQAGIDIGAERQTVEQFLQSWLTDVVKKYRKPATYRNYDYVVRVRIVPHIGHIQLDRLTGQRTQRMLNDIARELHPNTVRYIRTVLVNALNQAIAWGLLSRNPAQHLTVPKAQKTEHHILSEEEADRFLKVVSGHRFDVLYKIALSLGIRQGEILQLEWSDIDGNKLHIREGKTESAARTLTLSPVLQSELEHQKEYVALLKEAQKKNWTENNLVFPSERGKQLSAPYLRKHFKQSLKQAGLSTKTRFHDLRHSAASFLLAQGEHPRVIMEILGHSTIAISMNTYAHPTSEAMSDALSKLSDRLQTGYSNEDLQSV